IYLFLFYLSPLVASFFDQEILVAVLRVYSLTFIIQAFVGVQAARLTKELNFKRQMYMQIPSTVVGGLVGIFLALKGFGVWSLVCMYLITTTVFMLQHWVRTDWKPSLVFEKEKLKYHSQFGYKLTLSGILTNIYVNLSVLIIGKF